MMLLRPMASLCYQRSLLCFTDGDQINASLTQSMQENMSYQFFSVTLILPYRM